MSKRSIRKRRHLPHAQVRVYVGVWLGRDFQPQQPWPYVAVPSDRLRDYEEMCRKALEGPHKITERSSE